MNHFILLIFNDSGDNDNNNGTDVDRGNNYNEPSPFPPDSVQCLLNEKLTHETII